MSDLPVIAHYRELLLSGVPLLDVRAPVEFARGAFPVSRNIPLLDNLERHDIGVMYKEAGHDAAVALGRTMIDGAIKAQRVASWSDFVAQHPQGALYCFRGGQRSRIAQQWIYEATGIAYPRIAGGYKQLRHVMLEEAERLPNLLRPLILGGRTGVGKTRLLQHYSQSLDLEKLAHHRGSAFGRHAQPQPSQIDFEHRLLLALLQHEAGGNGPLVVEDESRNIGSLHIPVSVHAAFERAPLIVLEADLAQRTQITFDEYVTQALADFVRRHGEEHAFTLWQAQVLAAFARIERRLGGVAHRAMASQIASAMQAHRQHGDAEAHKAWISVLLARYYDPMYDFQLARKQQRICFVGDAVAVSQFLSERLAA